MKIIFIFCFLFLGPNLLANDVKISGGAAPMNNILKKIINPIKAKGIDLILEEISPEVALSKLDKGEIHAAVAGLGIEDWFNLAKEKGIAIKASRDEFKTRTIGLDRVQVIVNPKTKIKKLSADELKGIFLGKIKNWKEIGGADLPIVVIHGDKIGGTNKTFQKVILGGENIVASETVGTVPEIISKVSSKDGGVGLSTLGAQTQGVDLPSIPEIGRPISLMTRGAPSADLTKVIEFISGEGKALIAK